MTKANISPRNLNKLANKRLGDNKRHEFLKEAVNYDPKTGIFTSNYKNDVNVKGYYDEKGFLFIIVNCRKYAAERLAWFLVTGTWSKRKIQHKNGNITDNRFTNLEEMRAPEREIPKPQQPQGVHYSASERKWVAVVRRNGKQHYLGRFTSERIANKIVAKFIKKQDAIEKDNDKNPLSELQKIKSSRIFNTMALNNCDKACAEKILRAWGAWSFDDTKHSNISIIAKLMQNSNTSKISNSALIDIVERFYSYGYRSDELFSRCAYYIAQLKHSKIERCSDEEAKIIDELLLKTFGKNSPFIKIAVHYYVEGYSVNNIASYVQELTNFKLSLYQAQNRVKWCLDHLLAKFYKSYRFYEVNKSLKNNY